MSTELAQSAQPAMPAAAPLTIKEVVALLIRHHGFHDGKFDLLLEYQFGLGAFGPTAELTTPGVMVGLSRLGLTRAAIPGPLTVDAAEVNPAAPTKVSRARRSVAGKNA